MADVLEAGSRPFLCFWGRLWDGIRRIKLLFVDICRKYNKISENDYILQAKEKKQL
ncbi:MAG: hypothetical protein Q4Q33_13015 [Eubacteriales bacterium]|nr:hypothetical protein [Eubacteriales bacterium]